MPSSDFSALVSLAKAPPRTPMVSVPEFREWLVSEQAKDLVEFIYERNEPIGQPQRDEYRIILATSGNAGSAGGGSVDSATGVARPR